VLGIGRIEILLGYDCPTNATLTGEKKFLMTSLTSDAVRSFKAGIVLLNLNGTMDTLKCLDSIRAIDPEGCLTIVVDNGSVPDGSGEIAQAYPWVKVIRREDNGGWAGGNNTGIRYALEHGAEWITLLNNDTIVAPQLIDRLLEAADHDPDYGVLGPIIHYMEDPDTVMTDGCRFNRPGYPGFFERIPVPATRSDPPHVVSVDIVNGCCMMISRRVFERIGLIDERFFIIHEEADFCLRALQAGFKCGILAETMVWHKGGSWFKRTGKGLKRYYDARNLILLLQQHQAKHSTGKAFFSSWMQYLKYIYYRFCIEREEGEETAADAVLGGFCHGLAGKYGHHSPPPRIAVACMRSIFRCVHAIRGGGTKSESQAEVVPVRQA
jgi:GT2 family glycosyltransferase